MTNSTIENQLSMPPNTNSITASSSNLLTQSINSNNCDQQESTFAHHFHQPRHSVSQSHYQSTIGLPTTLNVNSTFYSPHFAMQQFSPITSSSPITAVSTVLANSNGIGPASIGINSPVALYANSGGGGGKMSSNFNCGNEDSSTVAFMEPHQQSAAVVLSGANSEDTSVNSSGSAVSSSSSADNGGTSSSGSISSLTSASQYDLYHTNSSYSRYRQSTEIKPENNAHYNEKYLHAFSESDIALATKPGAINYFDPSICHFSEDELRPQPMNKKSRKQTVPDSQKDDKYWARRAKNNVAAKKSREQRRLKENQVLLRASYLEKQNQALRVELQLLRCEHAKLTAINYLPQ